MSLIHEITVRQMSSMLRNLDRWIEAGIEHAEHKGFDPDTFMEMRLAPDMFPLRRQVQSACDAAKFAATRTAGIEAPKHEDDEKTLADLRARITETLAFMETVTAEKMEGADEREVRLGFLPGKAAKAQHYVVDFAVPNFYFHVVTAYDILRSSGVTLGKRDYIRDFRLYDVED